MTDENNKTYPFLNRVKEVLKEKGIKQTWLAEKIGKSFSQTNAYVCNRRQPSLEQLFEIAKILGVDVKELIDKTEKNRYAPLLPKYNTRVHLPTI